MINKNLHGLVNIEINSSNETINSYMELEFSHFSNGSQGEKIQVDFVDKIVVKENVYALGKGIFYDNRNEVIYISRNSQTSFFNEKEIYIKMTSPLKEKGGVNIEVCLDRKLNLSSFGRLKSKIGQLIKKEPRTNIRKTAEIIVSQFIEVNIYKLISRKVKILLHAAALENAGKGTLIFGPQNVGKTTITLGLAKQEWNMLGDDFCIVDKKGQLISYSKPLKIEKELIESDSEILNNSMKGRLIDPALKSFINKIPFYNVKSEYKVHPDNLGIKTGDNASIDNLIFLQRKSFDKNSDDIIVDKLSTEDTYDLILKHNRVEFDGNKKVDRELRQYLSLFIRDNQSQNIVIEDDYKFLKEIISGANSYLITMNNPNKSALNTIIDLCKSN